jgi:hypothetical protein
VAFQEPKSVRKLLNVRSPQSLKLAEITALVPFSTATLDFSHYAARWVDVGHGRSAVGGDNSILVTGRACGGH